MAEGLRPAGASISRVSAVKAPIDSRTEAMRFLPLRWLPERSQRLERNNPYLDVAGHESGHLLAAMSMGYIGDVSFVPDGNSLARVTLHGDVPVEDMKVIAAAGMVDTPFGKAFGYGSDKFKVQLMRMFYGGKDVRESRSAANTALKSYGPVWERFSEILAYLAATGKPAISAQGVLQAYRRALGELAIEKQIPYEKAENPDIRIKPYQNDVRTTISERKGYVVVTKVRTTDMDEVIEEYKICSHCIGIGQHTAECPSVKKEQKTKNENDNHNVFDWERRLKQLANPTLGLIAHAMRNLVTQNAD